MLIDFEKAGKGKDVPVLLVAGGVFAIAWEANRRRNLRLMKDAEEDAKRRMREHDEFMQDMRDWAEDND